MKNLKLLAVLFCTICVQGYAQQFIPLWPKDKKPNFNGHQVSDSMFNERIMRVGTPGIYAFPAAASLNTGTTILLCPGGSFERVSHVYNGFVIASWLNAMGINAYVLVYRLPHQTDLKERTLAPLQDAQRAMRLLRGNAKKWNLQPDKIGVMGTSAGGHVASSLGTHLKDVSAIKDSLDGTPFIPNFMVLVSPVISMGEAAHQRSKDNFLGKDPAKDMVELYSNQLQVSALTPPTFMVHALNDSTVPVKNSLLFFNALVDKKVNASIHVFPQGGHGIRMYDNPGSTELFPQLLLLWMRENKFLVSDRK